MCSVREQQVITGWLFQQDLTLMGGGLERAHDEMLVAVNNARAEFEARHRRVLVLKRKIKQHGRHFWLIGTELKAIRDMGLYRAGGYATFEEYLASSKVEIDRSTAYDWIGIVEDFSPYVGLSDIEDIDWGKLRKIRRVVREHPEQAGQWLAKARALGRDELNEELKKQNGDGNPGPSKRPISKLEQGVRRLQRALSQGEIAEGIQTLQEMLKFGRQLLRILEALNSVNDKTNPEPGPIQLNWRVLMWDEMKGDLVSVCIVANGTAKIERGQISQQSPVGAALLTRRVAEEIEVQTSFGPRKFRILYARPARRNSHDKR